MGLPLSLDVPLSPGVLKTCPLKKASRYTPVRAFVVSLQCFTIALDHLGALRASKSIGSGRESEQTGRAYSPLELVANCGTLRNSHRRFQRQETAMNRFDLFATGYPVSLIGRAVTAFSLTALALTTGCPGPEIPDLDAPFCGGIAGLECTGAGECVDDPRDDCDPNRGGADCGGLCQCNAIGLCPPGQQWDSSPEVCGCEGAQCDYDPCIATTCAVGSRCVSVGCQASCKPLEAESCGNVMCATGTVCCNASCGICTPPDGACIQIACEPDF